MFENSPYKQIDRHDAVYDDGIVKLKLNVESFIREDNKCGYAVYLSEINPPLAPDDYNRVVENISRNHADRGLLCSIE